MQPWADPERFAAAGGSYGGYMVNWMLGHTNRFKALVSHAGVYDLRSMAGETEELWFPKWEFRGMPWDNPEIVCEVVAELLREGFQDADAGDPRRAGLSCAARAGIAAFTALQMQKVPSKLLLFPDEGHWILKPQNSVVWHKNFIEWITEWTKKAAAKP